MHLSPWPIARSPAEIDDLFFRQRRVDTIGHNVHVVCAMVACLCAAAPTFLVEWAALPVLVCTLIRMTAHHKIMRPLWIDPVCLCLLAFVVFSALSILWSGVPMRTRASGTTGGAGGWLGDVQALRFALLVPLLWPVLDRRAWLIGAVLVGVALGECAQLVHLVGATRHIEAFDFHRMPGRLSGWWDPVVGGSILCAGLGMVLAFALFARTLRPRAIGVLGVLTTIGAIALTGSRGALLAGLATMAVAAVVALWRARARPGLVTGLVLTFVIAAPLAAVVVNKVANDAPRQRFVTGIDEVWRALATGDTSTDTGNRIAMAAWAWHAFTHHPIAGVGAGALRAWVHSRTPQQSREMGMHPATRERVHAHAHNWALHLLAIGGVISFGLMASAVGLTITSGLGTRWASRPFNAIDAMPALGLVGLVFAGMFDPISINAQTAYMLFTLLALGLPKRPLTSVAFADRWATRMPGGTR
jgi:hypothetical protein